MKHFINLVIFLFFGFAGFGQAASEKVSSTATTKVSLNKKMTSNILNAYQNHSKTKVKDVFGYFQLLTDATLSDEVKKEVIQSINQFFTDENTLVLDFTSESKDLIPLHQFLQKLLISEPILFSVSDEASYGLVTHDSWNTFYTVTRTKSGVISKIKVNQKMYFVDETKKFGTVTKNVSGLYLDEMQ
jgi:hypothetical protein